MSAYIESSALVKLFIEEDESEALRSFVSSQSELVTSDLSVIEVNITARRSDNPEDLEAANNILQNLDRVSLEDEIVEIACRQDNLKALDAIHAATAIYLRDEIDQVVVYDKHLIRALENQGIRTVSPGL